MTDITNRFYKNPTDTYVFIEHVWLDDIYRIDYNRSYSRNPVYGYRDKQYGQVAEGRELITGNIIVNFFRPGYLADTIAGLHRESPSQLNKQNPYNEIERLKKEIDSQIEEAYKNYNPGTDERREAISRVFSYAASIGMSEYTAEVFRDAFARTEPRSTRNRYSNSDPFAQKRHFDIQIYYGHPDNEDTIIEQLKNCALLGQSKTISAAGSPNGDLSSSAQVILEVYPFVAQTVEYSETNQGVN